MIGFAASISVVMTNGNIIHTCVHAAAAVVGSLPPAFTAIGMNILNIFVNFFIISGSGQAFVVMPIMSPLAQVVGVTQQTAILSYQLGDGLTNFLYPQSGVLMAALSVSTVPTTGFLVQLGEVRGEVYRDSDCDRLGFDRCRYADGIWRGAWLTAAKLAPL